MTWKQLFTSSVGKKFVMALTGVSLIAFLVVHVGINACIWANDDGAMFNKAAHFMGATVVIRILEVGLFIGIILHIVQGLILEVQNRSRRSIGYQVPLGNRGSKWYSRSMGLLGTLILLFLIMHIYHFWTPSRLGGIGNIHELGITSYDGKEYHNLYGEMLIVFQSLAVVTLYVLACISLAYHLMHGFNSAFRTLGLHNQRYVRIVHAAGTAFSIIVPLAFAMMPVSVYLGWVK
ncbi:succinate dehydrogenase cytochrome b subunit [Agriterribacter humi]|jgi:succinate dehydrogenase / fumarate reductase cytochrome b subunit|uniref:succinate dehydrogenase cytochrome b subunit n=1 Tax=Agriterribacter humi TaxID=1104781 RepID=UPI001264A039|nr:succinate dehydrogenase cytochrome b subunit [Agriterribacter humi]